jgi:dihydrofolate synthase/folylpolyglutamate synthase
MSYAELTDWMFKLERFGIKLGLENVREFMRRIGDPQDDFRSIHVTGTNGKGSVCVMASSILRREGLRVGLYTSPHLVDFRERIIVDGQQISEEDVVRIASELRDEMEAMATESTEKQLTFFEFTTGLAFRYFSERKVDIVVAEVGLGGRLDATNILRPEVSAITRIGLEHTNYLGNTLQDIAREKAGIVKDHTPVVTGERNPEVLKVIRHACEKKGADLKVLGVDFEVSNIQQTLEGTSFDYTGKRRLPNLNVNLLGRYQSENAACAIAMLEELSPGGTPISESAIREGLKSTEWEGRLDIISKSPLVILDGSHNPDGVTTTVGILRELGLTPLTYVVACMDDKDAYGIMMQLAPTAAKIICTQTRNKRALSAGKLAQITRSAFHGPVEMFDRSEMALDRGIEAMEGKGLCVIGSLYLVGEAIPWWNARKQHLGRAAQDINYP